MADKAIRKAELKRLERYGLYINYAQECAVCRFTLRNALSTKALFLAYYTGDPDFMVLPKELRKSAKEGLKEAAGGCELHHIVPICEGGSVGVENTILLCPNCHKKAHNGLISKEELPSAYDPYNPQEVMNFVASVLSYSISTQVNTN